MRKRCSPAARSADLPSTDPDFPIDGDSGRGCGVSVQAGRYDEKPILMFREEVTTPAPTSSRLGHMPASEGGMERQKA